MRLLFFLLLTGLALQMQGQVRDTNRYYLRDVAPIITKHCQSCHSPGGLKSDLPLTTYQQVYNARGSVAYMVGTNQMPPWPPDPAYSRLSHERALSTAERDAILTWMRQGAPLGDSTRRYRPVQPTAIPRPKPQPDLVVSMAQRWTHAGNNQDGHRVFVIPVQIPADKFIQMAEFIPGNRKIAHHAVIALDTTRQAINRDNASAGYGYAGNGVDFGFTPTVDNVALWVPGAMPHIYPEGIGKPFFRKVNVLVMMHYAPSSTTETDSSSIHFYFSDAQNTRSLVTNAITPLNIVNGQFIIPANTRPMFEARLTIPSKLTLLEFGVHAHLLGKSWEVFAIRPGNDTVRILKIPHWDFHWQGMYMPPQAIVLPAGTVYVVKAVYDNTVNNPHNPFSPPRTVSWGSSTNDEMFIQYSSFLPYQPGDDTLRLGPPPRDLSAPLSTVPFLDPPAPAPSTRPKLTFVPENGLLRYYSDSAGFAFVTAFDSAGAAVAHSAGVVRNGLSYLRLDLSSQPAGLYRIQLQIPDRPPVFTWYRKP